MIRFHVPGQPCGKQRARVLKSGRSYTPAKTAAYEAHVRGCARTAGMVPDKPLDGPLALTLDVVMAVPKSWSKRKLEQALTGVLLPTGKPDASNVQKSIEDALNGVVWRDDSQVVSWTGSKRYGATPGVWVTVEVV